jgi:hypothetical protein
MRRFGFVAGVLLVAFGLLLLLLIAAGIGLTPDHQDAALLGVDTRSFMTVAAGLCLASGITLVGLGFGEWKHPKPPEEKRDEAAITRPAGDLR